MDEQHSDGTPSSALRADAENGALAGCPGQVCVEQHVLNHRHSPPESALPLNIFIALREASTSADQSDASGVKSLHTASSSMTCRIPE